MYQHFYNLRKEPFHVTPDPEFLFLSPSHKQALGSIIYGVKNRKGFVVITGEVGVGKTTIIRSYLERIPHQEAKIVYIFNANVSFENLLRTIFKELGLDPKTDDVVEMLNRLYQVLMEEYRQGHVILLIIDEAQNMPVETLENLRMLSNLETSKNKLIQIVMVGQPEFEKILDLNELRQLKQRITIRFTIIPFTEKESLEYIEYRLGKVVIDQKTRIFTSGALKRIAREAKGIPRVLNILCDNALITGFGYKKRPVDTRIVKEVIADFKGKEKIPLWRWALAPAALLLLVMALYFIYPYRGPIVSGLENVIHQYKGLIISKFENRGSPGTTEPAPVKEETKPSADQPDISQTGRGVPAETGMEPVKEKKVQKPSHPSFPVVVIVKKGDNLYRLTKKVYGYADDKLLEQVLQNNSWIKDPNKILIDEEIFFPALRKE